MKTAHLKNWFETNFESQLSGRYITLNHLQKPLADLEGFAEIKVIGISENGLEIPMLKVGNGAKKILGWSQMHGNESTTTKGVFDFLKFLKTQKIYASEIQNFLKNHTFYIIPILNPDGAILNTRENFNKIDLNRDAQNLSQTESVLLKKVYNEIKPDLCLNLHDQRSIFGFETGNPASISFLAPSANKSRKFTEARKNAVSCINGAVALLEDEIPDNVGRFDDGFNINCVGDTFTACGTPTILVEAGHTGNDYERDISRYYVFIALTGILFSENDSKHEDAALLRYKKLPENRKNYTDILLTNIAFDDGTTGTIGCQYKEVLSEGRVVFELIVDSINSKSIKYGHISVDLEGGAVLINSQEKFHIGQKVETIFDVMQKKAIYC